MPRESADNLVQTVAAASSSSRESRSGSPTATSRRRGSYLKRIRCRPHCTRSKGTTTAASSANKGLWSCSILSTNVCRYPRPSLTHRLGGRLHQRRGGTPTRVLVPKKIRHVRPGNRRWSRGGCLTARQSIGLPDSTPEYWPAVPPSAPGWRFSRALLACRAAPARYSGRTLGNGTACRRCGGRISKCCLYFTIPQAISRRWPSPTGQPSPSGVDGDHLNT